MHARADNLDGAKWTRKFRPMKRVIRAGYSGREETRPPHRYERDHHDKKGGKDFGSALRMPSPIQHSSETGLEAEED